jgi:hypothetical protein
MALQDGPGLRYENGGALRDELDRYLRSEPIRALPASAYGRLRLWALRNPAHAARAGVLCLLTLALVAFLSWFSVWAWNLTSTAAAVAAMEQDGDLVGAARGYRELLATSGASWLLWLRDDLSNAAIIGGDQGSGAAVQHLVNSENAQRSGLGNESLAEREYAIACDRLCELLFRVHRAPVGDLAQRFLCRELRQERRSYQHRIVMDTWANYLIVQPVVQHFPPELPRLLRGFISGEPGKRVADPETRHAAVAALGAIREKQVLADLIGLLGDQDLDVSRLAYECSLEVYTWMHRTRPEAWASIDQSMMEAWATGLWELALRVEDPPIKRESRWFRISTLSRAPMFRMF